MLLELSIRNFAIIEDLSIRFAPGLTILSGETGAGKSIIINAVNLLLGGRAAAALIRTGAENAELEALFDVPAKSTLACSMADLGHDPAEGLMIRRIISRNDRHRIYINGRLSTIGALGELTSHLASISGQHAHQGLLKEDEHLAIVDRFGGLTPLREQYARSYEAILPLIRREQELTGRQTRQDEQRDLLRFQHHEIEQAGLSENEDEFLEKERRRLKNSENLLQIVQDCVNQLYSDHDAIVAHMFQMSRELAKAGGIDEQLSPAADQLESMAYGVEDLASGLTTYLKGVDLDPHQLEVVEERLDLLNKLKRKYGGTLAAVIAHGQEIQQQLDELENLSETLSRIHADIEQRRLELVRLAEALSTRRRQAARKLSNQVESQLTDLKMAGTRFSVNLQYLAADTDNHSRLSADARSLGPTGWDRATFMIAPNVGETAKPLAAIASGGELSRVVLALKVIEASSDALETMVFDEVDAGIGGSTADLVGKKLSLLANVHQVLCITHLPQIARYGEHHFRIEKRVQQNRTHTTITPLDSDERVMEIARMLGGEKITDTTLAHAREMLAEHR